MTKKNSKPVTKTQVAGSKKNPSVRVPIYYKWEEIISARRRYIAMAVFVLSLAIRLLYYNESVHTPIVTLQRSEENDMYLFDKWGKEIAGGDWLTNQSLHPMVSWNKLLADKYFETYPEEIAKYQPPPGSDSSQTKEKALWKHWWGGKTFHQEPLYPYLIGITYKFFGADVRWVFLWQILLGALSNVLIFLLAYSYFGGLAGIIASTLAVFCGPLTCFDLVLLRTTLNVFTGLLTFWLFDRAVRKKTAVAFFLFGISNAVATLNQSYFILFFIVGVGYILFYFRKQIVMAVKYSGISTVGLLLIMILPLIRNIEVGVSPFALASQGGVAYICANDKGTNPALSFELHLNSIVRIMHETDGRLAPTIVETIKTHNGLGSYLGLLFGKIKTILFWYEMPNNMNYYFFKQCSKVLNVLVVTNYVIAPLALVGIFIALFRRKERIGPLIAFFVVSAFPMLFIVALSRHRAGWMAIAILFGAFAVSEFIKSISASEIKRTIILLASGCLAFFLTAHAIPGEIETIHLDDYVVPSVTYYNTVLDSLFRNKKFEKGITVLDELISVRPPSIAKLNSYRKARTENENSLAHYFSKVYEMRGMLLDSVGRMDDAQISFSKSAELKAASE